MAHPSEAPTHEGAGTSGACRYPSDEPPERRPRRDEEARAEKSGIGTAEDAHERKRAGGGERRRKPRAAATIFRGAHRRRSIFPLHRHSIFPVAGPRVSSRGRREGPRRRRRRLPTPGEERSRRRRGGPRAGGRRAPRAVNVVVSSSSDGASALDGRRRLGRDGRDARREARARLVLVVVASSSSSDHEDPVRASPPDP